MHSFSNMARSLTSIATQRSPRSLGLALAGAMLCAIAPAARSETTSVPASAFADSSFVLTAGRLNVENFSLLGPAGLDPAALTVTASDDDSATYFEVSIPDGLFQEDADISSLLEQMSFDLFVTGAAISQVTLTMQGAVAGNASAYATFDLSDGGPLGELAVVRDTFWPEVLSDSLDVNGQSFSADGSIQIVTYADGSLATIESIRFDVQFVPEPSTIALAGFGGVAAALYAFTSRRRK